MQTKGPITRVNHWQPNVFSSWPFRWLTPSPIFSVSNDWPTLREINELFEQYQIRNTEGVIIKAVASPKKKPAKPIFSYAEFYEPRVYTLAELFTRENHWHDLINACVWMTFPKTKAALNKRHFHAFKARNPLPVEGLGNRSPEQDALTLFDEGGSIVIRAQNDEPAGVHHILFGHGAYECLVYKRLEFSSASIVLTHENPVRLLNGGTLLAWVDQEIAGLIHNNERFCNPKEFVGTAIEAFLG